MEEMEARKVLRQTASFVLCVEARGPQELR